MNRDLVPGTVAWFVSFKYALNVNNTKADHLVQEV